MKTINVHGRQVASRTETPGTESQLVSQGPISLGARGV